MSDNETNENAVDENKLILDKECIVKLKNKEITWNNLIANVSEQSENNNSVIEYIDVEENNSLMIANAYSDLSKGKKGERLPLKYTHLEIHPSLILYNL